MKILVVWLSQFVGHTGGMERALINFSNAMSRRGHEVTLMYCTERDGTAPFPIERSVTFENLVNWMPNQRFESIKMSGSSKIYRELWRIFDKEQARRIRFDFWLNQVGEGIKAYLQNHIPEVIVTADRRTTAAMLGGQKSIIIR